MYPEYAAEEQAAPPRYAQARTQLDSAGIIAQITNELESIEHQLGDTVQRLEGTIGRVFCEPTAVPTQGSTGAPKDSISLPGLMQRIGRIHERAASLDANVRRLAEQL